MGSDYSRNISKNILNFFLKESLPAFSEYIEQKSTNIQQTPVWFKPRIKMKSESIEPFFTVIRVNNCGSSWNT